MDAAQPGTDLRQSARHGRRNPRQYEDDGSFLGPCRPKRSSGGHRRIARDDPDLSEKQAEDEVSLIGLVISFLDCENYDGRPRTGRPANEPTSLPKPSRYAPRETCGIDPKRSLPEARNRT